TRVAGHKCLRYILRTKHSPCRTGIMTSKVVLIVPEAPPVQAAPGAAQRRLSREGIRLGLLDNSKGNADHLLRLLVAGVQTTDIPLKSDVSLKQATGSLT